MKISSSIFATLLVLSSLTHCAESNAAAYAACISANCIGFQYCPTIWDLCAQLFECFKDDVVVVSKDHGKVGVGLIQEGDKVLTLSSDGTQKWTNVHAVGK